ncbi:hypothetical protein Tco_0092890 [Tanacetum coccineum]
MHKQKHNAQLVQGIVHPMLATRKICTMADHGSYDTLIQDQIGEPYGSAFSHGPYTSTMVTSPAVPATEISPENS